MHVTAGGKEEESIRNTKRGVEWEDRNANSKAGKGSFQYLMVEHKACTTSTSLLFPRQLQSGSPCRRPAASLLAALLASTAANRQGSVNGDGKPA